MLSISLIYMLVYIDVRIIFANDSFFYDQLLDFLIFYFCKLLIFRFLSALCFSQMISSFLIKHSLAKMVPTKWAFQGTKIIIFSQILQIKWEKIDFRKNLLFKKKRQIMISA